MATTKKRELTKDEFKTLAYTIGKAMGVQTGEPWTVNFGDSSDWNPYFNLCWQGKKRVWCKVGWNKSGMLTAFETMERDEQSPANHDWNYSKARKEETTSINISIERTPEQIAKDIIKRLLPSVVVLVEAARLDREKETLRLSYAETQTQRLVEAIGNAGKYHSPNTGHSPYIAVQLAEAFDGGYGDIKPQFYANDSASVCIELRSLPIETAIKVCEALAAIKAG